MKIVKNIHMKKILTLVSFLLSGMASAQSVDISPFGTMSNSSSAPQSSISGNPLADKLAQLAQSTGAGGGGGSVVDGIKGQAAGVVSAQGQSVLNNLFSTERGTTEIGATTMQNGLPIYNILLVRPIWESEDKIHTTFTQMSVFTQNSRTTGNFGLGYRQLVADKKVLLGTNVFYDYEFPYGNQRSSIGGEIRSSVGELNLNYYMGTSGWVNTTNGVQEKSLGGYNAELAVALPYMPTTMLRANTFSWTGVIGLPNTKGMQYSITGPIWYGLNLDIGRVIYSDGALPNSNYAKLMWIFGGDISPNQKQFRFTEHPYELKSMEDRRYEKVRRENLIVKAQSNSSFGVYAVGY
jgi:Inverse autotransporter, beta-domain